MAEKKIDPKVEKEKRISPAELIKSLAKKHGGIYLKPVLVQLKRKGDFVVGKLINVEVQESKMKPDDWKEGDPVPEYNVYILKENGELSCDDRGTIAVTASSSLDDQMGNVEAGQTVVILYEGKVKTSKGFNASVITVILLADIKE